jgi:hypothetical protein
VTPVTVLVTLTAAVLFALSTVLEQRSTKQVPERGPLSPQLLLDLARRRLWLAALVLQVCGNVLQVVALHIGELALVQPLLVCDLLFAVLISVMLRHRRPDGIIVAGVLGSAAGLACFVALARPSGGVTTVSFRSVLPLIVALGAVLISCLTAARLNPWGTRAIWLALACGADFGVTAFLLKLVPDALLQGFGDPVRQWPLYLLVVVGPLGFLLNQSALQAGQLVAPVLAVITAVDPLVSIGIAHVWLDETIAAAPLDLAAESVSLAVMTAGIIALAYRAPQAARQGSEPPSRKSEQASINRSTI